MPGLLPEIQTSAHFVKKYKLSKSDSSQELKASNGRNRSGRNNKASQDLAEILKSLRRYRQNLDSRHASPLKATLTRKTKIPSQVSKFCVIIQKENPLNGYLLKTKRNCFFSFLIVTFSF